MATKKLRDLIYAFKSAKECGAKYIAVAKASKYLDGIEIIINPSDNFISKEAYYLRAYDNDLTFKKDDGVKIIGISYGETIVEAVSILTAILKIEC